MAQGAVGKALSVLRAGTAGVHVDGRKVRELGEGDCFGEEALSGEPSPCTVVAEAECHLLSMPRALYAKQGKTRSERAKGQVEKRVPIPL